MTPHTTGGGRGEGEKGEGEWKAEGEGAGQLGLSNEVSRVEEAETALGTLPSTFVAQPVKNVPEMRETWVRALDQEDPLEKGMATHSSILTWRIPWAEEPGGLQSMGSQSVGHD